MPQKKSQKSVPIKVTIRELIKDADWEGLYPLIRQLNKGMTRKAFDAQLAQMRAKGYRCAGAYRGKALIGAVGFWINTRFWCRQYIDLDNVVVDETHRGKRVGETLVDWVESLGKRAGCETAQLDCYTRLHEAQRFYFRKGYSILGYHFVKDL